MFSSGVQRSAVTFLSVLLPKLLALGFWWFESSQTSRSPMVNCISDELVSYLCFLQGRLIGLGREKRRHIAMNHFVRCPLISWPNLATGKNASRTVQEHRGWYKRKQRNTSPLLSRICVSIMKQTLLTIWQNHSRKNIYCFLSINCFWLQWANGQVGPHRFPFLSACTKDILKFLYRWHANVWQRLFLPSSVPLTTLPVKGCWCTAVIKTPEGCQYS